MAFASSSSSAAAIRSTVRQSRRTLTPLVSRRSDSCLLSDRCSESLSTPSTRSYSQISSAPLPTSTSTSMPSQQRRGSPSLSSVHTGSSNTTPEIAQAYLTDLFQLPPSRQFPPDLALQILTHKSFRLTHQPRHLSQLSPPLSPAEEQNWAANHNSRLNFIGRRAIQTYLTMFVHSAVALSGTDLRGLDFLRGKSFQDRMEVLRHTYFLGRTVGNAWDVERYMRWDGNQTAVLNGSVKIKGVTVEAIIGGLYSQFGSPAAHRAFHLHVLPHLKGQMFDPILKERAEKMEKELKSDLKGGSILIDGI